MLVKVLAISNSKKEGNFIKRSLAGYHVIAVNNIEQGLKQIERQGFPLVILDLERENEEHYDFLRTLKTGKAYKNIKIIIITDHKNLSIEMKGLQLGADDYIRKPLYIETLRVRIDTHVKFLKIQQFLERSQLSKESLTLEAILLQAPIGIAISHSKDPFVSNGNNPAIINPMYEQITGRSKEEIAKLGWAKITHPDDLKREMIYYEKLQSKEIESYSMEKRYIKSDGSTVWVYIVVVGLDIENGHKHNYLCLAQNIMKQKEIEKELFENERSKYVLLSHLPGMAYRCQYDPDWTMEYVSPGCLDLCGYSANSLINNAELSFNDLIAPEYRNPIIKEWDRVLSKKSAFKYEYEIITAQNQRKWVIEMGQGIYNEEGKVSFIEGIILDISDRKEFEKTLKYNNEHDTWTGLHNLRYLEKVLKKHERSKVYEKKAIIEINLSTIHVLSMSYGFQYSRELIKRVAEALTFYCSKDSFLFKTYENRFVFYKKNYKEKEELINFCNKVADTLDSILLIEGVRGGIGIVEIDDKNGQNVDKLLKDLLIASEKAINVEEGDLGICFFNLEMEEKILREEGIKRGLAQVIVDKDHGNLYLKFQPIFNLKKNQVSGFEALARFSNKKLGFVPPLEFIPIAEKTKLIIPIGKIIIKKALKFLKHLTSKGYDTISISINISSIQLLHKDFNKDLLEIINQIQVNPGNIVLEITETMFVDSYCHINKKLAELRKYGIKIALDDFGTGYSSLSREKQLNIDFLKIDKYFIDDLLVVKHEEAITGDIISMAHKLGHVVIAEGVESHIQKQYLLNHKCNKIQGYLISKPLNKKMALEFLQKQPIKNQ